MRQAGRLTEEAGETICAERTAIVKAVVRACMQAVADGYRTHTRGIRATASHPSPRLQSSGELIGPAM